MIEIIQPLIDEGKKPTEIVAAMNAATIRKADTKPKTGVDIKLALGSATKTGAALAVLTAIADGSTALPDGMPDHIRLVVRQELQQLSGAGVNLAEPGLNQFLRMIGLVEVAEVGIWHVSPWQDEGNEGEMSEQDLANVIAQDIQDRDAKRLENATTFFKQRMTVGGDAAAVWESCWRDA